MHYLQLLLSATAFVTCACAYSQNAAAPPVLACVAPEKLGCGCHIRFPKLTCANRSYEQQPQLFTKLRADAPLLLVLNGQERTLPHVKHSGTSVKGDSSGRSSDLYRAADLEVKVRYAPTQSTCPKDKADGCEFTDVRVQVTVSMPAKEKWRLVGSGTCGC